MSASTDSLKCRTKVLNTSSTDGPENTQILIDKNHLLITHVIFPNFKRLRCAITVKHWLCKPSS